jgi:hypothetical protein
MTPIQAVFLCVVFFLFGGIGGYFIKAMRLRIGMIDLTGRRLEEIYLEIPEPYDAAWIRFKEQSGRPPVAGALVLTIDQAEHLKSAMDVNLIPRAHSSSSWDDR